MTTLTEGSHAGEFIVSEANVGGAGVPRGRSAGTLASGQNLTAGTVVALNGSDEYEVYNNAAGDSTATAVGVLFDAVDATGAAAPCVVVDGDCEVNGAELNWNGQDQAAIDAGIVDLRTAGIRVR